MLVGLGVADDNISALLVGGAMNKEVAATVVGQYKNMTPVFEQSHWNITLSETSKHELNESLFAVTDTVRSEIKKLKPAVVIGYSGGGPVALAATRNDTNSSVRLIILQDSASTGIPRMASEYYLKLDPSWPSVTDWNPGSPYMMTVGTNMSRYKYLEFDSDFQAEANGMAASMMMPPIITDIPGVSKKMFHTDHGGLISDPAIVRQELDSARAMLNMTGPSSHFFPSSRISCV